MTACRECLLEAATIAEGLAGGSPIGSYFRQLAKTAPSWNIEIGRDQQRNLAIGDVVEVLLYSPPDKSEWVKVRVARFWRGGFDWMGSGTAGRVTWNEEANFWRRLLPVDAPIGVNNDGLVMASDLPGYESFDKTMPWGTTPATQKALERLDREVAAFDTSIRQVGARLIEGVPGALPAAASEGSTAPCVGCTRPIRAHINGLCIDCWRKAGRPDGDLVVVGEGPVEQQP